MDPDFELVAKVRQIHFDIPAENIFPNLFIPNIVKNPSALSLLQIVY